MNVRVGKIIDYFISGHTGSGYQTFLKENIEGLNFIYIISGGSVCIRSQLIRSTGISIAERGIDVEFLHGAVNPDLLEGIIFPSYSLAVIDGEIFREHLNFLVKKKSIEINLDRFMIEEKYMIYESKIKDLQEQINVNLELIHESMLQQINQSNIIKEQMAQEWQIIKISELIADTFLLVRQGTIKHRFGRCITSQGLIDFYEGLLKKIECKYFLEGINTKDSGIILSILAEKAESQGLNVEAYHCCLNPEEIELIIIPNLSASFGAWKYAENLQIIEIPPNLKNPKRIDEFIEYDLGLKRLVETQEYIEKIGDLFKDILDFKQIEKQEKELLKKILEFIKERENEKPAN